MVGNPKCDGAKRTRFVHDDLAGREVLLLGVPELEANGLFEHLLGRTAAPKALRAFQRPVLGSCTRLEATPHGPSKEAVFSQTRESGVSVHVDWAHVESWP